MNKLNGDLILNRAKPTPTGCWEWTGTVTNNGYGQVSVRGQRYRPHRVAHKLWNNQWFDLKSKLFICHRCDNKLCVNPNHLFAGTGSDNMLDCSRKGRLVDNRGSKHGYSKLNEDDILLIRALRSNGWGQLAISKVFEVTRSTISTITRKKNWKHL